jgi:hypothetical protein
VPLLSNGRAEAYRFTFYCRYPRCLQLFKAYEVPWPKCPDHGVPMKQIKEARRGR